MRIKLDENLPFDLVSILTALGHDVDSVIQEGIQGSQDAEIWQAAQEEERFLITQDLDFSDIRRFVPGSHSGILLIRLHNPTRRALLRRVDWLFQEEDVLSWENCLVVATDRKVRVRHPHS